MKILLSSRQGTNGITFHLQAWEPDTKPRAVVALVHGMGEHVARHSRLGEALVKAQFAVMGFDLRGHGRSGGPRGHAPNYDALMNDIDALLDWVRSRHPRSPVFLYGHSLGGALVLNYVLRRSPALRGIIATSPWLRAAIKPSALQLMFARAVDPILPAYSQKWGLEPSALSKDASVGADFERDPLSHGLISARMYLSCRDAGEWALQHAAEFPLPLLLMHGTADRLTSWEASQEFARRAGPKVTWRRWDGWYHELHNEPARARVLKTIVDWMNRRLENSRSARRPAGQMRRGMRKSRPILRRNEA